MQVRIPTNYRQGFQWLYGLDAVSGGLLGLGVVIGLKVLTGHGPPAAKAVEIAGAVGAGAFFGLGRWPLERQGDRMTQWARRAVLFARRPRRLSAFGPVSKGGAHGR